MAVRMLDNKDSWPAEFSARATVAITDNPTAGKYPGGLFVKFDTDPNYFVICGAGETAIGTIHSNCAIGAVLQIKAQIGQLRLITLGGTITLGADGKAPVTSDAAGKAVAPSALAITNGFVTKAGVAGDVVPLIFHPTAVDAIV